MPYNSCIVSPSRVLLGRIDMILPCILFALFLRPKWQFVYTKHSSILTFHRHTFVAFYRHRYWLYRNLVFHYIHQLGIWYDQANISGVGVTKASFVNFSLSKIFDLVKLPLRLFNSHLYLTGATAAELRRHLSSINVIFKSRYVFWQCRKFRKIIGFLTPPPPPPPPPAVVMSLFGSLLCPYLICLPLGLVYIFDISFSAAWFALI